MLLGHRGGYGAGAGVLVMARVSPITSAASGDSMSWPSTALARRRRENQQTTGYRVH
ncbi:hypothetical protein [Nocardia cyriacigeorgica]|uniref:hypothetical protein n=1 Tax=Nocardia cyriacigeorgica TaxID=135487 RepID=UPI002456E65E|nr:hypothetical protein [Nocardia cyriacigeorgica]